MNLMLAPLSCDRGFKVGVFHCYSSKVFNSARKRLILFHKLIMIIKFALSTTILFWLKNIVVTNTLSVTQSRQQNRKIFVFRIISMLRKKYRCILQNKITNRKYIFHKIAWFLHSFNCCSSYMMYTCFWCFCH